jgi:hypothetical protein
MYDESLSSRVSAVPLAFVSLAAAALLSLPTSPATAQSLAGSHESMLRQNLVAQQHDYSYLRTTDEVMQAVSSGVLVPLRGNGDYQLAGDEVSFPYARPEVAMFIEQLAHQYRATCGEPLYVTSLTRPQDHQPWNASPISVHPTGMAVDLRRSEHRDCRQYLERTLLALEGENMIEATRERYPAHYHVAVFPDPLLLPGPIGDPNGVARLAALHHSSWGDLRETEDEPISRTAHLRVTRSRNGRKQITDGQTAIAARHSGRVVVHHARRGAAPRRNRSTRATRSQVATAVRRHSGRSHAVATATAR